MYLLRFNIRDSKQEIADILVLHTPAVPLLYRHLLFLGVWVDDSVETDSHSNRNILHKV